MNMDEFVNYQKRGIDLPAGCKDLIDVLRSGNFWWVPVPDAGFAQIERYISQLLQCESKPGSVCIWFRDFRNHVNLSFKDGALLMVVLVQTADTVREQAALKLFREAGIQPLRVGDFQADGIPCQVLSYPLPGIVAEAAQLTSEFLRKVFGLGEDATLVFLYYEPDPAKQSKCI